MCVFAVFFDIFSHSSSDYRGLKKRITVIIRRQEGLDPQNDGPNVITESPRESFAGSESTHAGPMVVSPIARNATENDETSSLGTLSLHNGNNKSSHRGITETLREATATVHPDTNVSSRGSRLARRLSRRPTLARGRQLHTIVYPLTDTL